MAVSERTLFKNAPSQYRRYVMSHPAHAVLFAVVLALGFMMIDPFFVAAGAVVLELGMILVVPRLEWARGLVDARIQRRAHALAAEERRKLLERMSDQHRNELFELERVASLVRERCGLELEEETGGDALGLERLIELYVRLAIAHRATNASLEAVGPVPPEGALRHLEEQMSGATELVREAMDRRRSILLLRCDARRTALHRKEAMAHALAAIGDVLRWMHEHGAAPSYDMLRRELEAALATRAHDVATLLEFSTLHGDDFDGSVIAHGRPSTELRYGERVRIAGEPEHEWHQSTFGDLDEPAAVPCRRRA